MVLVLGMVWLQSHPDILWQPKNCIILGLILNPMIHHAPTDYSHISPKHLSISIWGIPSTWYLISETVAQEFMTFVQKPKYSSR